MVKIMNRLIVMALTAAMLFFANIAQAASPPPPPVHWQDPNGVIFSDTCVDQFGNWAKFNNYGNPAGGPVNTPCNWNDKIGHHVGHFL
jgi:hypothetical protein